MAERSEYLKFIEGQKAQSDRTYERNCCEVVCRGLIIPIPKDKYEEFGFNWLHQEYPSIPVRIDARKIKPSPFEKMVTAPTKTEAWQTYFQAKAETDREYLALIVMFEGCGMWAIHNAWFLPATPGFTRVQRIAAVGEDKGIIIEPVKAFCAAIKQRWSRD